MPAKFNWGRFQSIIRKEFIQICRDPISLRIPFVLPIVMMLLFGYAVNTEVENISTVVLDQNRTTASREYIRKFSLSGYFNTVYDAESLAQVYDLIDRGKVKTALIIPADFDKALKTNSAAHPLLLIDGSDPTTARTAMTSGLLVSQFYSSARDKNYLKISAPGGVSLNTNVLFNPNMESDKFTIPALVGLILQNITVMLTAFALVREKERGTIEQLMVTPIRPFKLIIGKLIPCVLIGYAGFLFALALCIFWFQVPLAGSLALLLVLGLLFVVCSLSMGMLISTIAQNQLQAMMVLVIVILPSVLLSGFIFPRENMPWPIFSLGYLIPLTYFLQIIRGIMLKGVGIGSFSGEVAALVFFTGAILLLAVKRFRKSLD